MWLGEGMFTEAGIPPIVRQETSLPYIGRYSSSCSKSRKMLDIYTGRLAHQWHRAEWLDHSQSRGCLVSQVHHPLVVGSVT